MKNKFVVVIFLLIVTAVSGLAQSHDSEQLPDSAGQELYDDEFASITGDDIYEDVADVELTGSAGLTPDSSFYFLESLVETVLVGNNPETALKYKEEKVLEAQAMVAAGNPEAAKKALAGVDKYNEILQKEVTPELDQRVRQSSKATKLVLESFDAQVSGSEWDEVKGIVVEDIKAEDKVAIAAKIANKVEELCKALADLDPLQYAKVCKTDDDSPKWKKNLDKKLTKDQEKEAKAFFGIMSACFKDPSTCRCDEITIKPFAEKCKVIAPLVAACEAGDEDACEKMDAIEDPIDLLPDYLQDVLDSVEDQYGEARHDLSIPKECVAEGALSRKECMRVMFKLHAPLECQEALARGDIDSSNEKEARQACEKIMFASNAPSECIDAGLKDHRECDRYMFKLNAPRECLDAGLSGEGRDDHRKCDQIRFKLEAAPECLEAGLDGSGRDDWKKCEALNFKIDAPQECLDAGLDGSGRDDWKRCEAIRFKLDAPQECLDAGLDGSGRDDHKKCDAIRFRVESPQECLDAGLDGTGRRDWDKCNAIRFKLDAPQECLDAGIDGSERNPWDACNAITFKLDNPECVEAGIDGTGRDDWKKCERIRFKLNAPQECLDAGLDGSGRNDWDKCNRLTEKPRGDHPDRQKFDTCNDCQQVCNGQRWQCVDGGCSCFEDNRDEKFDDKNFEQRREDDQRREEEKRLEKEREFEQEEARERGVPEDKTRPEHDDSGELTRE